MNSLRSTVVFDTTPLQRLENQSSCSEPSSPTLNSELCVGGDARTVNIKTHANNNNNNGLRNTANGSIVNGNVTAVAVEAEKREMELYGTRKVCCRLLLDFLILGCVGLPIMGFNLWGDSYKRGFFCNDDSLMHPYHESTIPSWMLYFMCFVVPITIITIVEFFSTHLHEMHIFGNLSMNNYYLWHLEIPDWIVECYKHNGLLIFGAGICELTTDIAKYSIGRLRPHFFAVCQPLMNDGTTCDDIQNEGRYIEDFTCRGLDYTPKILKEAHLSFPSGHASFTCFTMIYIAIYLHKRLTGLRMKMFKHLLQFMFLMFAWYTSLTRVSDYKHHWTDVLAGSLIGYLYAVIVTCSMW
ncbi:putative phosphatidate phosphatase isoform X4 [Glossina fuscipes]|uniref:Phosphatidate phosphatase isoform X4 n=1 Tax=Glossina fuscipes TaxID=7396 RepID=A0A9C5Z094_9MUSC|nr:putative phosphatidate phosphatase isoform X4 [Glossina fuscipes]